MLIDGVYGHQYIARKNIAAVLSAKVGEGLFDRDGGMPHRQKHFCTIIPPEFFRSV